MKHLKNEHYMNFNWQMAFADGNFDVEKFIHSREYQESKALSSEYAQYKNDPENPAISEFWNREGISRSYYACDRESCNDVRKSNHYTVLGPLTAPKDPLPVVYFCHGGGQEAMDAEVSGMAEAIPESPFWYVCPNQYGPEEFRRILNEMEENGYPIDDSRVYVVGFSGGSGSALEIAASCPEQVAGVALIPGPNAFNQIDVKKLAGAYHANEKLRTPLICIGGTCDGGDRWPLADEIAYENLNEWMGQCSRVSGYRPLTLEEAERIHRSGKGVEAFFGMHFDHAYVNKEDHNGTTTDQFIYTGDYLSEDGTAIVRMASVYGMPHGVFPSYLGMIRAFLFGFSRNTEDGGLIYEKPRVDFRTWRPLPEAGSLDSAQGK